MWSGDEGACDQPRDWAQSEGAKGSTVLRAPSLEPEL